MKLIEKKHRVAVVLDECFGRRVLLLATHIHVWIAESPENFKCARALLDEPVSAEAHPLESGVTVFRPFGSSRFEVLLNVMDDIEDHHGEYAHDPEWTALEIYGIDDADAVGRALAKYGVIGARTTSFGVEAWRR